MRSTARLLALALIIQCSLLSGEAKGQYVQQGTKLVGTEAIGGASQGSSVAISGDGTTAIVGGYRESAFQGAAWVFTRSGGVWTQQGAKLVGTGASGAAWQGHSVALSADGNTALVGGPNDSASIGAAWVFTRSGGVWTQQGQKLVGTGRVQEPWQGYSVALSADGNTAIVGGYKDNGQTGAAWVFTRSGGVWTQQGEKLVGTGSVGIAFQGSSVSLSSDGSTAVVGAAADNIQVGAAWVFTRSQGIWSQQGEKLVGADALGGSNQGGSVSLSSDGNTFILGGPGDNNSRGAVWVFTRTGGVWSQQGGKLVGSGITGPWGSQGTSVSLSSDGNTAFVGGPTDNGHVGAAWVFTRSGGVWTQQGDKLVPAGFETSEVYHGNSVSLSSDGNTAIVGAPFDSWNTGAAWVFVRPVPRAPSMIAYYPLDGNAIDSSGNGSHGNIVGGVTSAANRFNTPNSAFAFDGSTGHIAVPSSMHPLGNVTITYSCWVKPSNDVSSHWRSIIDAGSLGSFKRSALMLVPSHQPTYTVDGGQYITFNHALAQNQWAHLTLTKTADSVSLYVNGVLDGTWPFASSQAVDSTTIRIGGPGDGLGYYHGILDDIRIYDYSFTASQVDSLYRLEERPPDPETVVVAAPSHGYVTGADTVDVRWYRSGPVVTRYWLETSPDSIFEFTKVDSMVADTMYVIRNLVPSKEYWWRVRAYSGWSYSPYSAPRSIHIVTAPGQVQLLLPAHGQVLGADSAVLSWQQAQQFVDRYTVEFSMDSSFALRFADSTAEGTSYVVRGTTSGILYWWRVKAHNAAGWGSFSTKRSFSALFTGVEQSQGVPLRFALDQNYPNPFNPTTVISFQLPVSSDVRLVVYDLLGREVAVLMNEKRQAGVHTSTFDASSLGSGMYLYRLFARPAEGGQTAKFVQTRKLMLIK